MPPNKPKLNSWKKLSSRVVYKNQWIKIHEDRVIRPDGKKGIYGYMVTPPAVLIVALTDNQELFLLKQPRYTQNGEVSIEIPAGNSDGEDPLKAAKRELQEETGLLAKKWEYIGEAVPFNSLAVEVDYIYIASGLTQSGKDDPTTEGIFDVFTVNFTEAFIMIKDGTITDGQTITAITKAAMHLGKLKFKEQ